MSLGARAALIDDRSEASNPGGLSVQPFHFASHFPFWPSVLGIGLLVGIIAAIAKLTLLPVPILFLVLNLLYWTRVRLRFRYGCINPATVVSTSPFILAVYTNLTTGGGEYPVIKIIPHPTPRGTQPNIGDACATVSMYSGDGNAEHWEDFDPILASCATNDQATIARVLRSISAEDWSHLDEGLQHIPRPLKTGLYPLLHRKAKDAQPIS